MTAPSRATPDGRAYLDLRNKARIDRRPVDELLHLYVLECFLERLAVSRYSDQLVLKGGVLLAAFGERRPTRDVDLQAEDLGNDAENIKAVVCEITAGDAGDGVVFEIEAASAEVIRDEDAYSGVRVTIGARLATARPPFHVDVSFGDPITPEPGDVHVPRLLRGELVVRGYRLAMVHAEKIVTAITRGTVNTRWRDFADIYLLSRRHPVDGSELARSIRDVADHRGVRPQALSSILDGYAQIGQARWAGWRRKQTLDDRLPESFGDVISAVVDFADPAIDGRTTGRSWDPESGTWS
ncbi:MAG: nucleotidyl transferase AbiEii/AbiGii toxin family protein [Actinomycetota bacterium]